MAGGQTKRKGQEGRSGGGGGHNKKRYINKGVSFSMAVRTPAVVHAAWM
jgi:hypothetical protein